MDFFRNLTGASAPDEPPASVLAEWNKYNGGDIESQTAVAATQAPSGRTFLTTVQESVSGAAGAFSGPQSSTTTQTFRIPSGTDFVYFAAFFGGGLVFFFLAFVLFLPVLIIAPGKFAVCFTLGSICLMSAFNMLSGWQASVRHMVSADRLPFTASYVASMLATLYGALVMKSYVLSIAFSGAQVVALLYYTLSYFPGGAQGVQFVLAMAWKSVTACFASIVRGS